MSVSAAPFPEPLPEPFAPPTSGFFEPSFTVAGIDPLLLATFRTSRERLSRKVDEEDDHDEHQSGGPGQLDLVFERGPREVVDQYGERRRRFHEIGNGLGEELRRGVAHPIFAEER